MSAQHDTRMHGSYPSNTELPSVYLLISCIAVDNSADNSDRQIKHPYSYLY